MSWFRRQDPWEELLSARLTWICTCLALTAKEASEKHGYDYMSVVRSRWFNGYLLAIPQPLDAMDELAGGVARKVLFHLMHGNKADDYLRKSLAYVELEDQQTREGVGAGVPDGDRCWTAVAQRKDLPQDVFQSLQAFFSMKSIKQDVTIDVA